MKNKGLILTIIVLTSLLNVGCSRSDNENEQALYNRIILDYYEQRFCKQKNKGMNMYHHAPSLCLDVSLDEIAIEVIYSKLSNGAYIIAEHDKMHGISTGFMENYVYAFNGEYGLYGDRYLPADVWYKGNIYYLTDAFYEGIVSEDDIKDYLTKFYIGNDNPDYYFNGVFKYNHEVEPLKIETEITSGQLLSQMRQTVLDIIDNENRFENLDIVLEDIHVFQSYAYLNGIAAVTFSIDGITPPRFLTEIIEKKWDTAIAIGNTKIEPFQEYIPVVYISEGFHTIDEAYESYGLSENLSLKIIEQYKKAGYRSNLIGYSG